MADNNLFGEHTPEVGFEEAAPDIEAKDMTINEAITELQYLRDTYASVEIDKVDVKAMTALDMAIEALFDEMISAERFKHFATKYGKVLKGV